MTSVVVWALLDGLGVAIGMLCAVPRLHVPLQAQK